MIRLLKDTEQRVIDETLAGVTYVGTTSVGLATSLNVWQIQKIEVVGSITTISYP